MDKGELTVYDLVQILTKFDSSKKIRFIANIDTYVENKVCGFSNVKHQDELSVDVVKGNGNYLEIILEN